MHCVVAATYALQLSVYYTVHLAARTTTPKSMHVRVWYAAGPSAPIDITLDPRTWALSTRVSASWQLHTQDGLACGPG